MRGRPSKYQAGFAEQARKLCELGATDREVAAFFGVQERTVYRWQAQFPEFCQALKIGKVAADERVERSLYRRAVGYSFDAVKINQYEGEAVVTPYVEHVAPDVTACIFWLKNRKPVEWRDVKAVEHSGSIEHRTPVEMTEAELDERIARALAREEGKTTGPENSSGVH